MKKMRIMNMALISAMAIGMIPVCHYMDRVTAEPEKEVFQQEVMPEQEEVPEAETVNTEQDVSKAPGTDAVQEIPAVPDRVDIQEETVMEIPAEQDSSDTETPEIPFPDDPEEDDTVMYDEDSGEVLKGLQFIDGDWYCFDENDGHMIKGLVYHKELRKTYCYDPENGKRCTGTHMVDGKWYYMSEETWEPCSGWITEFGKKYYIDEYTAEKTKGQAYIDENWYLFDETTGEMLTGFRWLRQERKTVYYSAASGMRLSGEQSIGGYRYYFDVADGAMRTGFVTTDTGKRAYFNEEGHMLFGVQIIDWKEYYFDPSTGAMHTGFRTASGNTYYYSGSGVKQFGWTDVNGTEYYFDESTGAMATGRKVINGKTYFFDSAGHQVDFNDVNSLLVVANKKHRLPVGYAPSDLMIPEVPMNYTMYLRAEAAYAIEHMFAAAANAGISLRLGSAYRSESLQNQLYYGYVAQYGAAVADTISSRPGYSDHQTGLAADISDHDGATYLTQAMENTPEGRWLRDHAHEYGFIMRYPKGKDAITGYSYEPWHFRYIGVEYATAIYNTDVWYSFEEYFGVEGGDYN